MDFGRHPQGREVFLLLLARTALGEAAGPLTPPSVAVFDAAGVRMLSDLVPAIDRYKAAGLFAYRLFLGAGWPAGRYQVSLRWASASGAHLRCGTLEVVAGGDPAGPAVSMYSLERPQADYVCMRTAAGKRFHKRNPYL